MKPAIVTLLLFVPLLHAQTPTGSGTANYFAKWSSSSNLTTSALCQSASGGLVGIATCFPTQRLQVNSGDALVKGVNNFTASGQVARYFVGDRNHTLGAAFGAGLYFSTYQQPYALTISDRTGNVGIGTGRSGASFLFQVGTGGTDLLAPTGLVVDKAGHVGIATAPAGPTNAALTIGNGVSSSPIVFSGEGDMTAGHVTTFSLQVQSFEVVGSGGIEFADGTTQTTAYVPSSTSTAAIQQLQRDRDNLAQLVRQLQARVDRLEKSRR